MRFTFGYQNVFLICPVSVGISRALEASVHVAAKEEGKSPIEVVRRRSPGNSTQLAVGEIIHPKQSIGIRDTEIDGPAGSIPPLIGRGKILRAGRTIKSRLVAALRDSGQAAI